MKIRIAASLLVTVAVVGCKGSDKPESTTTTSAPTSSPTAAAQPKAAAPASATKDVALAPLPLKLTMPSGEVAETMDKTMGERKSVGVSYDAVFGGINVSEPSEKSFDAVKKGIKADGMFPFKKWVKDEPKQVISEFSEGGKTGYLAYSWREVGGKPYVCQSAGLAGMRTVEDAEKVLKVCDTLAAK